MQSGKDLADHLKREEKIKSLKARSQKELPSDSESESENEEEKIVQPTKSVSKKMDDDKLINMLKNPALYLMIGKSRQGKSYLMRYLVKTMAKRGDFQFGLVFAATKFNGSFDWIANQNMVISGYDEEVFKKFLQKLQAKPTPSFVIFEDLAGVLDWHNNPLLVNFLNSFRHYKVSVFILVQYAQKLITPNVREQADYAFLFHQKTKNSLVACYENFGMGFDSLKDFQHALEAATSEKHYCMTVMGDEEAMDKRYGRYKAPEKEPNIILNFGVEKKNNGFKNQGLL